jgi:hypothetical protein
MISFFGRTIQKFLSLFQSKACIYFWLAKTSQQPISQTTWLKVTIFFTIVISTTARLGWPPFFCQVFHKQPG